MNELDKNGVFAGNANTAGEVVVRLMSLEEVILQLYEVIVSATVVSTSGRAFSNRVNWLTTALLVRISAIGDTIFVSRMDLQQLVDAVMLNCCTSSNGITKTDACVKQ